MKLELAALVGGPGIKKPPRVIRETEQVEQLLTASSTSQRCGRPRLTSPP